MRPTTEEIEKGTIRWRGIYRGIRYEVVHHQPEFMRTVDLIPFESMSFGHAGRGPKSVWNYYLHIQKREYEERWEEFLKLREVVATEVHHIRHREGPGFLHE